MRRITIDPRKPDDATIRRAAKTLRKGGLVAFPTETVYGIGALGLDPDAVARIYAAKGRPAWNPVILHVATAKAAERLVKHWPREATALAKQFWPGPLTLVLPKAKSVPSIVTAGLDAVAIRIPDHPVALALLREVGAPIAAPSANRFTQVSPTNAEHVQRSLGEHVDLILDGGESTVGIESTVLDLSGEVPTLLRPGMITREALEAVLGTTVIARSERIDAKADVHSAARSPGSAVRHYAPHGDVWLARRSDVPDVSQSLGRLPVRNGPVAALVMDTAFASSLLLPPDSIVLEMPVDPAGYARALYAALHEVDERGASVIIIEQPPENPEWDAIRDRLTRAAAIP